MYHCLSKTQSQSIAPEDEITLGLTHRPSDVVDVLYQSRYVSTTLYMLFTRFNVVFLPM